MGCKYHQPVTATSLSLHYYSEHEKGPPSIGNFFEIDALLSFNFTFICVTLFAFQPFIILFTPLIIVIFIGQKSNSQKEKLLLSSNRNHVVQPRGTV